MIARPKISRNERKSAEKGAFEVGNFAPFSCPGDVPLDVELKVTIDGVLRDVATLGGLDVGGARGVAGTVRWLADALAADGAGLRPGSRVLAATPGALIPLAAADKAVVVSFGSQVVSMAVGDDDAADDAPNPRAETEASGHMAWGDAT